MMKYWMVLFKHTQDLTLQFNCWLNSNTKSLYCINKMLETHQSPCKLKHWALDLLKIVATSRVFKFHKENIVVRSSALWREWSFRKVWTENNTIPHIYIGLFHLNTSKYLCYTVLDTSPWLYDLVTFSKIRWLLEPPGGKQRLQTVYFEFWKKSTFIQPLVTSIPQVTVQRLGSHTIGSSEL